jgi:hypothetical protein
MHTSHDHHAAAARAISAVHVHAENNCVCTNPTPDELGALTQHRLVSDMVRTDCHTKRNASHRTEPNVQCTRFSAAHRASSLAPPPDPIGSLWTLIHSADPRRGYGRKMRRGASVMAVWHTGHRASGAATVCWQQPAHMHRCPHSVTANVGCASRHTTHRRGASLPPSSSSCMASSASTLSRSPASGVRPSCPAFLALRLPLARPRTTHQSHTANPTNNSTVPPCRQRRQHPLTTGGSTIATLIRVLSRRV